MGNSKRRTGVFKAKCKYCKEEFDYYTTDDTHECCLKREGITKAVRDGIYTDYAGNYSECTT